MLLLTIEIAAVAGIGFFLYRWYGENRRKSAQSWDSLLARLHTEWSGHEISDKFLWADQVSATPEDVWQRMEGPKGLWAIYKNAQVMLEMADFASQSAPGIDPVLLANLRSDAMQIKLCVLTALCQYAFSKASEGVRVNAYRTAQMYVSMAARMTQILQDHAAPVLPDFVAAM
jgi:hypothetical protein